MLALLQDHDYLNLTASLIVLAFALGMMAFFVGVWWRGQGFEPEYEEASDDADTKQNT